MTQEEFIIELDKLEQEMNDRIISLSKKYAISNKKHKIGDVVTDNIGSVLIDHWQFTRGGKKWLPENIYSGYELKKDGSIRKDKSRRSVYEHNIIEKP